MITFVRTATIAPGKVVEALAFAHDRKNFRLAFGKFWIGALRRHRAHKKLFAPAFLFPTHRFRQNGPQGNFKRTTIVVRHPSRQTQKVVIEERFLIQDLGDFLDGPCRCRLAQANAVADSGLVATAKGSLDAFPHSHRVAQSLAHGQSEPARADFYRLHSAGIVVRGTGGAVVFRCNLYRSYLEKHL